MVKKRTAKYYETIIKNLESAWDNDECDNPKDVMEEAQALLKEIPEDLTDLRSRLDRLADKATSAQFPGATDSELINDFNDPAVLKQFVEDAEDLWKAGRKAEASKEAAALLSVMPPDQKELIQRLQRIAKGPA